MTDTEELVQAREAMSEIGVEAGRLPALITALKEKYKLANEEIAELSHPEFGSMGRLEEEISELKKEVEWLQYFKENVYHALGPADEDVVNNIRQSYKDSGKPLPQKELDALEGR